MLLTHKVKTTAHVEWKQVIFNTYLLMTKMQLNIISYLKLIKIDLDILEEFEK